MKLTVLCFLINRQPSIYTMLYQNGKFQGSFKDDVFIQNATLILRQVITNMHNFCPSFIIVVRTVYNNEMDTFAKYSNKLIQAFEPLSRDILAMLSTRVDSICQDLVK